jgi:hypothetical protein
MQFKRFAVFAALFTLALAGLTLPANAQQYKGTFTLPVEAHWGPADLEPGDYTIWTDTIGPARLIHVRGNGIDATILGGPVEWRETSDRGGRLELTEVNGKQAVTKLVAGTIGKEFSFDIPKALSRQDFRGVALQKATIPVSNGK